LTIAGVDSSGGAGIAADLAAFASQNVWGACVVTAVTAQNSVGVTAIQAIDADVIAAQIDAVCSDMTVGAIKTGMLGSTEIIRVVAATLPAGIPLVVDPVMVATTGAVLATGDGLEALIERATLVTPNAYEAEVLTGIAITDEDAMARAARALLERGCDAALVKGGHIGADDARDCLIVQGQAGPIWLESARVATADTHGTGCVLSAAIAARLARGDDLVTACRRGKEVVTDAIRHRVTLGKGVGAVDPLGRGAASS
jgi:hydroxymethylpyrimidine/phosphomethylpyrimidine kinase